MTENKNKMAYPCQFHIERKSLISPYINPEAFQDLAQLSGDEFSNLYEHLKDELDQMERELDEMRVKEEMRKTEEMEERLRARYEQENRLNHKVMTENKNKMAYPCQFHPEGGGYEEGLTKLELFAIIAMQGILPSKNPVLSMPDPDDVAKQALLYAEALLNQLPKPEPK